jgi:hypothetical protein
MILSDNKPHNITFSKSSFENDMAEYLWYWNIWKTYYAVAFANSILSIDDVNQIITIENKDGSVVIGFIFIDTYKPGGWVEMGRLSENNNLFKFIDEIKNTITKRSLNICTIEIGLFNFYLRDIKSSILKGISKDIKFFNSAHIPMKGLLPVHYMTVTTEIILDRLTRERSKPSSNSKAALDWENIIMTNIEEGNGDLNGL